MSSYDLTAQQRNDLATVLHTIRDRSNSIEAMGWAISNYVLTEGAAKGHVNGDKLEIPITITVSMPQEHHIDISTMTSETTDFEEGIGVIYTCVKICHSVFGVELFCREDCHESAVTVTH